MVLLDVGGVPFHADARKLYAHSVFFNALLSHGFLDTQMDFHRVDPFGTTRRCDPPPATTSWIGAPTSDFFGNQSKETLGYDRFRYILETMRHGYGCFFHGDHLPTPTRDLMAEFAYFGVDWGWWNEKVGPFDRSAWAPAKAGDTEPRCVCNFRMSLLNQRSGPGRITDRRRTQPVYAFNGWWTDSDGSWWPQMRQVCSYHCANEHELELAVSGGDILPSWHYFP